MALAMVPVSGRGQSAPIPATLDPSGTKTPPATVSVDTRLTSTNNGNFAESGKERSDWIASVRPQLTVARRGAGFEFDLSAAATFLGYANGTQDSGILPDVRASLKSALVERWLYVDAQALVRQSEVDPFGTRAEDTVGGNRRTESTYRLSPYIEREFAPNTTLLARHDLSTTNNGAGLGERLTSNYTLVRVERKPVPFGASAELSRLSNKTSGDSDSDFTLDTARLRATVLLFEQLELGALVGRDRSDYLLSKHSDSLYGASIKWSPGPRTDFSAVLEHRFFGQAGTLSLQHRTPFMAFSVLLSRQPVSSSASLGVVGQGGDVRSFLDAILTTRYPDPVARSGVVDGIVNSRGLDTRTSGAIDLVADYPQLQTVARAGWTLLGSRNTASVIVYSQTNRQLTRDDDPFPSVGPAFADTRQRGANFQFNHRLTPQLSADALVRWSKVTGLAAREGESTDERSYRVSLMQALSPRTGVSAGLQYNRFTTTAAGQQSYDATLAFVGMSHRF
jgi:uncharacterized protein (PEP-CTERM system associated)